MCSRNRLRLQQLNRPQPSRLNVGPARSNRLSDAAIIAFLSHLGRRERGEPLSPSADDDDRAVNGATRLHGSAQARRMVRGLVLADASASVIAEEMRLPISVVQVDEADFWNVRPLLKARGAVAAIAFSTNP